MSGVGGVGGGVGTNPVGGVIVSGGAILRVVDLVLTNLIKPILLKGLVR